MFLKKAGQVICFPSQNDIVFWFTFSTYKLISKEFENQSLIPFLMTGID